MLCDRYDPLDLFTQIPTLCLQFEPVLAQLDQLLEDDQLFTLIKRDLARRFPQTPTRGRPSTPVEVILRLLVVRRLYGWSYEETERFVADSLILRQFCRLYLHRVPDDTTLLRWANLIGPATIAQLNDRVVALAQERQLTRGRKLRVDTTLVETNIHQPTDGSLLADGVRVISRLLRRAKERVDTAAGLGPALFRARTRSVRPLLRRLRELARRQHAATAPAAPRRRAPTPEQTAKRRQEFQAALQTTYRRLIRITQQSVAQAQQLLAVLPEQPGTVAARLRQQLQRFVPRVQQVIQQTKRRVLAGEAVPAAEKLVSLFEPQTQIIKRGKPGRAVEFGRKVLLAEVEGGIISQYQGVAQAGSDAPLLPLCLAGHQERFGRAPQLLTGDRGFFSPSNEQQAHAAGVKRVVIPAAGRAAPARQQQEKARWFRRGYRFRAGIEGRISGLKRRFGWDRCLAHGETGLECWVGWGVVTANLEQMARRQAARQAR